MLKIRLSQLSAFEEALLEPTVQRFLLELRTACAGWFERIGEENARNWVMAATIRGRGYGLPNEASVLRYLKLRILLGPDADDPDWLRSVLSDKHIEPHQRISEALRRANALIQRRRQIS